MFALKQDSPPLPPPDSTCTGSDTGNKKTITGTDDPDTLIGTSDRNVIRGLGGDDRIHGCGDGEQEVQGMIN